MSFEDLVLTKLEEILNKEYNRIITDLYNLFDVDPVPDSLASFILEVDGDQVRSPQSYYCQQNVFRSFQGDAKYEQAKKLFHRIKKHFSVKKQLTFFLSSLVSFDVQKVVYEKALPKSIYEAFFFHLQIGGVNNPQAAKQVEKLLLEYIDEHQDMIALLKQQLFLAESIYD